MNTVIFKQAQTWAILCVATLMASSAYADRRTALHGNMLIQDRDDTFIYPQLALRYNKTVSLDVGATSETGNALLIAGPNKRTAIGIALHRGDAVSALGNTYMGAAELGMMGNSNFSLTPANALSKTNHPIVADLIYAMRLGKNKLGFRLGVVGESEGTLNDGDHVQTEGGLGFRLGAGYSMGKRGDFAFNAAYNGSSIIAGKDSDVTEDASNMLISLSGRYYLGKARKGFRMGTLFDIAYLSASNTQYDVGGKDPAYNKSVVNVMAGMGPVYSKANKYKVGFYGHLGLRSVSTEPNTESDNDEASQLAFMFPGFNVAMEYRVLEWLDLRGGASYSYILAGSGDPLGTAAPQYNVDKLSKSYNTNEPFSWNAGFGIILEHLQINGSFSHGFLTNGPQFVGGNNPGFLSMLSLVGKFGGKPYRAAAKDPKPAAEPAK